MKAKVPHQGILVHGSPTDKQREMIEAWILHGSSHKAAKETGLDQANIGRAKNLVQKRAEKSGWSPTFSAGDYVPSTEEVIGRSILTKDDEGNNVWLKTKAKKEEEANAFKEFITGLCDKIKPVSRTPVPKLKFDPDLMSAIFIGDAHIGMYAYGPETKHSDFDTDKAADGLREAIDNLIDRSPDAETGLLVDVGDFMHMNSSLYTTLRGTRLDVDTRYSRVLRVAGQVMNYAIGQMLKKFKKVIVVIAKGNHNEDPAVAVQEICAAYYHKEPRATVLDTDGYFHYIEWGKWLIGVNHGDKIKPEKLVNVMSRDMAQAWGRTTHRMWATGHFHHKQELELDGCTVYKFGALPPPDAWHAGAGFGGDGKMEMITFKKQGGTQSSHRFDLPRPVIEPDLKVI
jgi:hypothetical protein